MELGSRIVLFICSLHERIRARLLTNKIGAIGDKSWIMYPYNSSCPRKMIIGNNCTIGPCSNFIINPIGEEGRFIFMDNSASADGLTVITNTHNRELRHLFKEGTKGHLKDEDKDVIVEEDVWIGANVTLCIGVRLGRGSSIGAGSVVRSNVPPYSVVMGNPAKVVGFAFSPEEIIEHEKSLYSEDKRLSLDTLNRNYNKYYVKRVSEISNLLK